MARWWAALAAWGIAAACAGAGPAAAETVDHGGVARVEALRTREAVVVDGRLDEESWRNAVGADAFRQREPHEGAPASERTELRVAYDDDHLYVGLRLFDREPGRIVRQLSRRDERAAADRVAVYLDSYHDHRTAWQFEVSAAGVQRDAAIDNDYWEDVSWDAVWDSAVTTDPLGWNVEMKIPFSQLRFGSTGPRTWGINVVRFIHRTHESDWLELVPRKETWLASRMAHLSGLDGVRPRRGFAVVPYGVSKGESLAGRAVGGPFGERARLFGGIGIDLKYNLTTSLSVDAAVNPDFGQVEVDPAVVNLTQFETSFEEKRPFFVEGASILRSYGRNGPARHYGFYRLEPTLFYSRRIGRGPQGAAVGDFVDRPSATTILGAAKLTGKTSGWSLSLIEALTGQESARTQTDGVRGREVVEPRTQYLAARAHHDSGRAGVGVLGTAVFRSHGAPSLEATLPSRAVVAGVDGHYFLDADKDWVLAGRLAVSNVQGRSTAITRLQRSSTHYFQRPDALGLRFDPGRTSLSGWTGSVTLNRNGGNRHVSAVIWATSPGFDSNDVGFNPRSDRWGGHLLGTIRGTDPDRPTRLTRSRSLTLAKWYVLNFDRQRQSDGLYGLGSVELRNFWTVEAWATWRRRASDDQLTRGGPAALSPAQKTLNVLVEGDSRRRVTWSVTAGGARNEFGGSSVDAATSLGIKPAPWLSLSLGPSARWGTSLTQYVASVADDEAQPTYGRRYVFADLGQNEVAMTVRVNWILSPHATLQLYAQPLVSAADYREFKELARPQTHDFLRYGSERGTLTYDAARAAYSVDPDGSGPANPFEFAQPDFNLKSFRLNVVFRWEWRLGSTLYAVWQQKRESFVETGQFALGRDAAELWRIAPDDVFLVKVSYRFGR